MKRAIFTILLLIVLVLAGCTSSNQSTGQTTLANNPSNSSPSAAPAPSGPNVFKMGEKFNLGDLSYVMNSIDQIDILGNNYLNKTTEGMYYLVEFTIENNGNSEKDIFPSNDFTVTDEKGRIYKPSLELAIYAKTMGFEAFSAVEK